MTPKQFEEYVCEQFRRKGYQSETTSYCSDYGVDVFASKGKEKIAIQVKMYGNSSRKINRQMVMELHGAKDYFNCTSAVIATNGNILPDAQEVANKLKINILYFNEVDKTELPIPEAMPRKAVFDEVWQKYIVPLKGRKLYLSNGEANEITNVDWSGIERITSNGKKSKIKIEIFRYAVNNLMDKKKITREEINQNYAGRASSGVILILSQVPFFVLCSNPSGLICTK
jgi:restriction system protein